jgi:hypothetical protein
MTAFKQTLISFAVLFLLVQCIKAQTSEEATSGTKATIEPRYLYNLPTAGMLRRGAYSAEGWFFAGGGAMSTVSVGLSERFTFGVSYGAGNLIGSGNPNWNPLPGVMARYRLIDEELQMPAIAIGFESQGRGNFISGIDRYERKSPGFFAVATKNFEFLGFLSLTGGANYSLESKDDGGPNFYIGAEKTIGREVSVYAQYDFGLNDNKTQALGDGNGFLDVGVRVSLGVGLMIELNLTNLNDNFKNIPAVSRSVRIEYVGAF